ncbi:MAG TPA: monovalent cation/H+ antiporter complex subunit F [Egibacteraceae bacterium]
MTEVVWICSALLLVSAALCIRRIVSGPLPDRVVALDSLLIVVIGAIAVGAAHSRRGTFIDVLLVGAVVAFIGTTMVARYIEQRGG